MITQTHIIALKLCLMTTLCRLCSFFFFYFWQGESKGKCGNKQKSRGFHNKLRTTPIRTSNKPIRTAQETVALCVQWQSL